MGENTLYQTLAVVHTIPDSFCAGVKTIPGIGLLLTPKDGDFGAISDGAKLRRASLISKVESHTSDRCSYYTTG